MKLNPYAIATVAVLGTAAVLVGSGTAATENGTNPISQQLLINQRISQAAVKRSNQSLNYLAPIRTTTSDAANTGASGVTPLNKVAGSGQGWTTAQIANQAITPAKLSNPSYFAVVSSTGAVQRATSGVTVTATVTGNAFTVTFPSNVSGCAYTATVGGTATGATAEAASAFVQSGAQNTQVVVNTYQDNNTTPANTALPFHLIVQC